MLSKLNQNRDTFDFYYRLRNSTSRIEYVDNSIPFNEWHLVMVTFTGAELTYYSKGVVQGNAPDTIANVHDYGFNVTLSDEKGMKGVLDDFRYYDVYKDEHFAWYLWNLQSL